MSNLTSSRPFVLGLCGPTGAGKSTLTELLCRRPGWRAIREPHPVDLLADVEAGVAGAGYALQHYFITASADLALANWDAEVLILDRLLPECYEVFLPLHRELGNITTDEFERLRVVATEHESRLGMPDAMIVLWAPADVLLTRMRTDVAHVRPEWLMASLDLQLSLYRQWLTNVQFPFVEVDTSSIQPDELVSLANGLYPMNELLLP